MAADDLFKVGARLGEILGLETSSRISVASFVDHYLRLLDFPADVLQALAAGEVKLFEAAQLARFIPERLGSDRLRLSELALTEEVGARIRRMKKLRNC